MNNSMKINCKLVMSQINFKMSARICTVMCRRAERLTTSNHPDISTLYTTATGENNFNFPFKIYATCQSQYHRWLWYRFLNLFTQKAILVQIIYDVRQMTGHSHLPLSSFCFRSLLITEQFYFYFTFTMEKKRILEKVMAVKGNQLALFADLNKILREKCHK